ncbi:MAG: CoA transferase [Firmicutes bacterium]|nr:CoA transferase [Bacillota bacterium]
MSERMALEDIVVLDLTRVLAGPYCGSILADFGATVIKIEQPGVGDDSRHYGPHLNGESLYYGNLNRNKYGITLNLKSEEGKKIFRKLVEEADVVIENYRYGVMDRLGLGYEQLKEINPGLIYGAITGFGSNGPYRDRPGYDIISQAMGGLMSVTGQEGDPPTRCGSAMGDVLGGLNLAIGVLVALNARHITGKGQYVDVSIADSVVLSLEQAWQRYFVTGEVPVPHGNYYDAIAPYDSYQAKDGWMVIGCGNQRLFEVLCTKILQKPELITDERFISVPLRVKNNKEFKKIMERWLLDYSVNEAVDIILGAGIPAGPILNVEQIAHDEHFTKARELFVPMNHPICGEVLINGNAVKMSDTKASIRMPSPTLGQHTSSILQKYGYSQEDIDKLALEGVV